MLVYLHRYREADADESARADEGGSVDHDASEYFDVDALDTDGWERIEHEGRAMLRTTETHEGVAAVSVPKDHLDPDRAVPGLTIQLRTAGGETEYVENARVVEVQDADPVDPA